MKGTHLAIQRCTIETGNNRQTDGFIVVADQDSVPVFTCLSLELPWRNNQRQISHIPAGTYIGRKHNSPKFGVCVHIQNVPGRSEILIHPANFVEQLLGCVAAGRTRQDIDKDGSADDVSASRDTMTLLLDFLPDEFPILILDREHSINPITGLSR